jgi:hypothetical protein
LASIVPTVKNLTKVGPGVIGVTLGRNPNGAASQTAENFRSLQHRWNLIAGACLGSMGIWALNALDVISRWSFFIASVFWILAVIPNLVSLATSTSPRRVLAGLYLALGLALAAGVDWSTALDATGKRIIAMAFFIAVFGLGAQRMLESSPRPDRSSPDLSGLREPFSDNEIAQAERGLGVVL